MKLEAAKRLNAIKSGSITPEDAGKVLNHIEQILGKGKPTSSAGKHAYVKRGQLRPLSGALQRVDWKLIDKQRSLRIPASLTYDTVNRRLDFYLDVGFRIDGPGYSRTGFSVEIGGTTPKDFMSDLKKRCGHALSDLNEKQEEVEFELNGLKGMNSILTEMEALN